jgi:hypothetical protein
LTDVNDPLFRCYESDTASATSTATVVAGSTVGFKADNTMASIKVLSTNLALLISATSGTPWCKLRSDGTLLMLIGLPQYFDAYLAAANPVNSESAGSGASWFKIWDWAPTYSKSTGLVFASENIVQVNFTVPKATPSGTYLLRLEQIALHAAGTYQGAQFYIASPSPHHANHD